MFHKIESFSVDFTFKSKMNDSESVLDNIFASSNLLDCIENYSVLHRGDNFSDHCPVMLNLMYLSTAFKLAATMLISFNGTRLVLLIYKS